jgi:hypothetical protein
LTLSNDFPLACEHLLLALSQLIPLKLERGQVQDSSQVSLQQTRLLAAQSHANAAQTSLTSTQLLRDPIAGLSSLELMGNHRRMTHHLAQIVPDEGIQLLSGDQPGRAMLFPIGADGRQLSSAHVILVGCAGVTGTAGAAQLAVAATDQAAQQVWMDVVPTSQLLVGGQALLRRIEHVG